MTDEATLLAAVAATPDDDTPRLVYADWCDDHGRPDRAEFVRVQCRLAAGSPTNDDYPDLLDRQEELVTRLTTFEPFPRPLSDTPLQVGGYGYAEYRRGFPDVLHWSFAGARGEVRRLLTALGKHLPATPARSLRVYGMEPDDAVELVRSPVVAGLRGLTLQVAGDDVAHDLDDGGEERGAPQDRAGTAVTSALAASPHLKHLRHLAVALELTDSSVAILAGADLPNLTELNLNVSTASPQAVSALARAKWFPGLRVLRLRNRLGDAHLEAVAALPPLPHLHTLDLADNHFESAGLRALAASKSFPALAALDLSRNPLGTDGARALGEARWSVRALDLRGCQLTPAGVRALLAGPLLDGVRVVELGGNDLPAAAVQLLAKSPKLEHIRHLLLAFSKPGKDGFAALGKSPNFRHLTRLDLGVFGDERGGVKGADVVGFLATLDAPQLRHLSLDGFPTGVSGAKLLASRPTFANLRRLGVQDGRIGNSGLAALAASPHLRGLVSLDLWTNQITAAPALTDPATFPQLADCKLLGNKIPKAHAAELAARRGLQVDKV
jgi:uncharacterized protein (TIGR02996 family)